MAPPTPTTTPMTVVFVFEDMLEEVVPLLERAAEPVAFEEDVVWVDDDRDVMTLPETVVITVTTPTLAEGVVDGVSVGVVVGVLELVVFESSEVLDELLGCVGVEVELGGEDGVGVGVDEGVGVVDGVLLTGVLLAGVLFTVADAEGVDEPDEVVALPPNNPLTSPDATELIPDSTSFFSTASLFGTSRWKRFESNQFA